MRHASLGLQVKSHCVEAETVRPFEKKVHQETKAAGRIRLWLSIAQEFLRHAKSKAHAFLVDPWLFFCLHLFFS